MRKIIILGALIITAIISFAVGYKMFSFDRPTIKLKERDYVMPEIVLPTAEENVTKELEYILYPMYGEILIYQSDGGFYDYTGIFLCDLDKEEQIDILRNERVFTMDELYHYLESLTS